MRRSRSPPGPDLRRGRGRRRPRTRPRARPDRRGAGRGRWTPAAPAASPARSGTRRPPPHRRAGRCGPGPSPSLLEIIEQEPRQQILLALLLLLLLLARSGRLRHACRPPQSVGVSEESLLHLVGGVAQDD